MCLTPWKPLTVPCYGVKLKVCFKFWCQAAGVLNQRTLVNISFMYVYVTFWFVLQQSKALLGLFYLVGLPGPGQNQGTVFGLAAEVQTRESSTLS